MRTHVLAIGIVLAGAMLTACAQPSTARLSETATASPQPTAVTSTCADDPNLIAAVDAFVLAAQGGGELPVHGETGGRRSNLFDRLDRTDIAAMRNPKGGGTLLSVVYGGDDVFARSSVHRAAWLYLDGVLYPVDVDAAESFALRWAGYPEGVKQSAGLGSNYFGLKAYGLSDFETWNADTRSKLNLFQNEANELCATPTLWG